MTTYGPYSPIKQAGNTYYISGQVGIDPATKMAKADIASQTSQTLDNLVALLKEHNLTTEYVVKTTIFVTDMLYFAAVNDVYQTYFDPPRPARSTVAVRELPRLADVPLLVEIEAIAYKS